MSLSMPLRICSRSAVFRARHAKSCLATVRCQQLRTLSTSRASRSSKTIYDLSSSSNSYISLPSNSSPLTYSIPSSELQIWPSFLDAEEQAVLLAASLKKLDATIGSREERKRKREWLKRDKVEGELIGFAPDEVYDWQDRHFDGVISSYRETTLSFWPSFTSPEATETLSRILKEVYALLPSTTESSISEPLASPSHLLTHLLHLSSKGYILPHVDNIEASAGSIVGISLGAERELVLQKEDQEIRLRLPAGSAYLQKGSIRYDWKHSIPLAEGADVHKNGQRLSVMIRDRL